MKAFFANIIKEERQRQRISQTELARRSGLSRVAISKWENERKSISLENADKLLKALGVEIKIGGDTE